MTVQTSDIVIVGGQSHQVIRFADGEPFVPTEHGFCPVSSSTACWRGYLCVYEVRDGRLILDTLHVNHQSGDVPASRLKRPPPLNGAEARTSTMPGIDGWTFECVGLWLRYTGSLRIGCKPYRQSRPEPRFLPVTQFGKVFELTFEHGGLTSLQDLSVA